MSRTANFTQITGVAQVSWTLKTATPLCVKSGTGSAWRQSTATKTRNINAEFDFFTKQEGTSEEATVADFYHLIRLQSEGPSLYYTIPPSSVRGALRNHTIRKLVDRDLWCADLVDSAKKDEASDQTAVGIHSRSGLRKALETPGWNLVQNLFGLATDTSDEHLAAQRVAGRLQVSTEPMDDTTSDDFKRHLIHGNFHKFRAGATNGRMVITPRSPLCRITQAAKHGGLHSLMELDRENCFKVHLQIVNPAPEDLGLVAYWEQEIDLGFLRLGGLTAIGRGRLALRLAEVKLFQAERASFPGKWVELGCSDLLIDIFPGRQLEDWQAQKARYLSLLQNRLDPKTSPEEN